MGTVSTYCRICEQLCGMTATVEDGELVKLRPNKNHPISQGFACPKGIAMVDVVNDPDRVLAPLRRKAGSQRGVGGMDQFEPISWDQAFDEIGTKLGASLAAHGPRSVGAFLGNPVYFSYSPPMWVKGFFDSLGSPHLYTPSAQDTASRFAASAYLYGSPFALPIPDVERTDFLLVFGANPLVSHGSLVTTPGWKSTLKSLDARGGRLAVVDPRRTETAQRGQHVQVRPDTDAWLLGALVRTIFEDGLEDRAAIARSSRGVGALRTMVFAEQFEVEVAAARCGVPAETVRQLARDFASARSAVAYGRIGVCRGRHPTLVNYLIDCLNVITGNFDTPGGAVIGKGMFPPAMAKATETFGKFSSRIGGFPELFNMMPSGVMAKEMLTPGDGQIRSFFTVGGNPMLSLPDPKELADGLRDLDLHIAIDLYVSETALFADYVLPATTFYEKHDTPVVFTQNHTRPFAEATEPVIAPRGGARDEWRIIDEIARRVGVLPYSDPNLRRLARLGLRLTPKTLVDVGIRLGPYGDLFGIRRGGLSLKKLSAMEHGAVMSEHQETGEQRRRIRHKDGLVHLAVPELQEDAAELGTRHLDDPDYPMLMISLRELRSHNSWMHNSPTLMAANHRQRARMNDEDASELNIEDGARVRIVSPNGEVEVEVRVTPDVRRGTVAVPHGWGHTDGSWRRANAAGGANVNVLASTRIEDHERISGMSLLDGIPVRVEPLAAAVATPAARDARAARLADPR